MYWKKFACFARAVILHHTHIENAIHQQEIFSREGAENKKQIVHMHNLHINFLISFGKKSRNVKGESIL